MATHKGREGSVTIGATPGTAVGEVRSFELNISANLTDASRMGDEWAREESTQKKWSASIEMFWDLADTGQDLLIVGERVTVNLFPKGNGVGSTDTMYSGTATVSEVGHKQAHDGLIERTVSLTGYGALTESTI